VNRLIGFYSPAAQSGKSLAANVLAQQGYRTMSFAEPIKRMGTEFFISLGYTREQAMSLVWGQKEKLVQEINTTPRHVLQTLGTEWGRQCISESIWIDCMMYRVSSCFRNEDCRIVIDDIRFQNEAEMIKKMGGEMWKIIRPSVINSQSHQSEGGLDNWDGFDQVVENSGTIHDFRAKLNALIAQQ